MTTPLRQFILKRGNTAASSSYTGPVGEITFDTGLQAIRIHDGITPGGALMPSNAAYDNVTANVTILQQNVVTINSTISSLANVAFSGSYNDLTDTPPGSSSGPTPPENAQTGSLWYDSVSGRLYVNFDGFWIDASPESVYTLPIASNTVLGGIKIGGNLLISEDGTLSAPANLGNLTINDQTINGTVLNRDITLAPLGTGNVSVPSLSLPTGSILTETAAGVEVVVASLTLDATVDYSVGLDDFIPQNTYGTHDQINAPWAIYRFTTIPTPALVVEDVIAGDAIPVGSTVLVVGTGIYQDIVVTDTTITGLVPSNGTTINIARPVANAALALTTNPATDIALLAGAGGQVVVASNVVPVSNDLHDLGTPTRRFRRLWLGAGSIYVQDETTGGDVRITAIDGNLVVAGAAGLRVGEFTFTDNKLLLADPTRDIVVGQSDATGYWQLNRPMKVVSGLTGNISFDVNREGRTTISTPNLAVGQTMLRLTAEATGLSYLPPQIAGGSLIHVTNAHNVPPILTFDSFGDFTPLPVALVGRRFRGTVSAPAVVQANDAIISLTASGYAAAPTVTGLPQTSSARMVYAADETFTSISQAARLDFYSQTPNGNGSEHKTLTVNAGGIILPNVAQGGTGTASITFPDGSIQTAAWLGNTSLISVNANIAAANVNIAALQSNAVVQALQINSIGASAVNVVTAGTGVTVSRTNGTVGISATGVQSITGTANQIIVGNVSQNITLSLPQSINTNSSVTFGNVTVTGNLNIEGNIISSENVALDSKILYLGNLATSADQIDGGGIILGNVNAAFKRSITYDYNGDRWDTDGAGLKTLELYATDAFVETFWNNGAAHFGATALTINYDNAEVQIDSNRDNYSQLIHQNHNSGTNASTDFVAANDIGNDTVHYIDMGINSSSYTNAEYNIGGANDGYLYVNGGNLTVGTQSTGNVIKFHTSGTTDSNLRVTITDDGLSAVGNIVVGGNLVFADGSTQSTSANTVVDNFTNIFDANLGTVTNNINTLFSNAAGQATDINTINSNVAIVNNAWTANAVSQENAIAGLRANITAANVRIQTIDANLGATYGNVTQLQNALGTQGSDISSLRANITAANAAIVTANNAVVSYVNTLNSAMISNVNAANSAIVTANNAVVSYVNTLNSAMISNVNAANSAIVTANSAVVSYVNTLNSAMIGNVNAANAAAISYTNIQIQGVTSAWTANAAFQEDEITALRANITAANLTIVGSSYGNANVAAYLPINSTIQAINANVTAANAAISGLQNAGYATITQLNANVSAANSAIITANTGMKSYVDGQISTVASAFTANAGFQETEISGLRANITAANALISSSTYSNTNVSAYLSTVSSIKLGNIQITDQTIAGTVFGRDMNFTVNDSGASFIFGSNIFPSLNYVYTLGTKTRRWAKAYHGPHSLDVDGILLDTDTETAAAGSGNLFISNAGGITANMITSNNGMRANGNVSTSGNVWATGNVRASFYLGDGSKLTNLPSSSGIGTSVLAGLLTVNPTSVGKTSASTQTFTITGLTTNHKVNLTSGTALTYGIFISAAWASATDTVSVQFMNITGGGIDLGNIDLEYIAWV